MIEILQNLGGFEIVQLVGAILAAAEKKMLIVIDGFMSQVDFMKMGLPVSVMVLVVPVSVIIKYTKNFQ